MTDPQLPEDFINGTPEQRRGAFVDAITRQNGNYDTVALMLAHRADVNWQDEDGDSACHWASLNGASLNGHLNLIRLLITSRANVDLQNVYGNTPLHWARRHVDAAIALVAARASIDTPDNYGNTL